MAFFSFDPVCPLGFMIEPQDLFFLKDEWSIE